MCFLRNFTGKYRWHGILANTCSILVIMDNSKNQNAPDQNSSQGRSEHGTGSTTQGGSNYGQGSSNLGGTAYEQGATKKAGSNYENEGGRLGDSSVGTPNEGSSSPKQGAQEVNAGNQDGGGAAGYDVSREQQQISKEQEDMHNERDQDQLNVEREQTSLDDGKNSDNTTDNDARGAMGTKPSAGASGRE